MHTTVSRRSFLAGAVATTAVLSSARVHAATPSAVPAATIGEPRVISHLKHRYHGWPTIARRANGELLLVCSGGRESHVCPFGRIELMRSHDDGKTWSWPEVVMDGPIDDRDAGVLETAQGTLLVTTFTSLAYEPLLQRASNWSDEKLARWESAHQRVSAAQRQAALGVWMKRSTDGGLTWSARYDCLVDSPHGPIQLADGRLLYAGKELWREPHRIGVCESSDDGQTWRWLAEIPTRAGDDNENYHELHAIQAANGRIIVQIRNHNAKNSRETLQCESDDGGKTWTTPRSIGVWGLPSHLLRLQDDRLLMTYGHRRAPLGNQARVSDDHGKTWSGAIVISGDGASGDLGYPSTVQVADGSLVTVWYELLKGTTQAQLRQATWRLE